MKPELEYIITDLTGSYTLEYSPEGWRESTVHHMRSEKYHAVSDSASNQFKFTMDGAEILKRNYFTYGVQAVVSLTISKLDRDTQLYAHPKVYAFDFSNCECIKDFFVISLTRGGLIEKINARENNVYELFTVDTDPDKIVVTMQLPALMEERLFTINEDFPAMQNIYMAPTSDGSNCLPNVQTSYSWWDEFLNYNIWAQQHTVATSYYCGLTEYGSEIHTVETESQDTGWCPKNNPIIDTWRWFVKNTDNVKKLKFTINISGTYIATSDTDKFFILLVDGKGGAWQNVNIVYEGQTRLITEGTGSYAGKYYADKRSFSVVDKIIPYIPNAQEEWHLIFVNGIPSDFYFDIPDDPSKMVFINGVSGTVKVEMLSDPGIKVVNALPMRTVYKHLLRRINDGVIPTSQSNLLDLFKDYLLISGDGLRGFDSATIKTSWSDFFKAVDILCAGAAFEVDETDKAILESLYAYYSNTEIANLGEVNNLKIKPYTQVLASSLNIGYKDVNIDSGSINGRFEYNTTHNYTLPVTKVEKVLDMVCPYQAGVMAITLTAINRENKTTTDASSDNDVFVLVTKSTGAGTAELERDNAFINAPLGFTDEAGAFNIAITPLRLLLWHGGYLHSICDKLESSEIVFNSTNKNKDLISRRNIEQFTYVESTNIPVNVLLPKIFDPILIEFEAPIYDATILDIMASNEGYFTFTYNGITYKGFIFDVGYSADRIEKFTYTLIGHCDNDYSNLI